MDECKPLARGWIYNTVESPDVLAPTQMLSNTWKSNSFATLRSQYTAAGGTDEDPWVDVPGRGLHSSTFWLNVSIFCGIRWLHEFPPAY